MLKRTPRGYGCSVLLYIVVDSDWAAHGGMMVKYLYTTLGASYNTRLYCTY